MQLGQPWVHVPCQEVLLGLASLCKASTDASVRGQVMPHPVLLQVHEALITYQHQDPGGEWGNNRDVVSAEWPHEKQALVKGLSGMSPGPS